MDLKKNIAKYSGQFGDALEDAAAWADNEFKYRANRIQKFWGIPTINPPKEMEDMAMTFMDPKQREIAFRKVGIGNGMPKSKNGAELPSEILDRGIGDLVDKGLNSLENSIGLDKRALAPLLGLTIVNPKFMAKGAKKGWASGEQFGEGMRKWNARRNELRDRMKNPEGLTTSRQQKNSKKALVQAYNDVSTGPSTDPLDVEAYGKKEFKVKGKDQHHLFPKQESYQFVERMKKIGDDDDVLNLMMYAEELDATMGGRLSNMLNMDKKPHNVLHGNRIGSGRELKSMEMKNLVSSAKSSDELMELFDRYIVENIQPSKAEAKQLQKAFEQTKNKMSAFNSLSEAQRRRL